LNTFLDRQISILPLITFRIVFGLMMVISTMRFLLLGWIDDHYLNAKVAFHYYGFSWVQALPEFWMYSIHGLMLLAAIGITLGAFYRLATVMFFLTFTYVQLIDLTYYLNHYYFVSLIALLMMWLPANASHSMDVRRRPKLYRTMVPAWTIDSIKFQIALVYIFAGLAKLNYDWLILALPLKIWLPAADKIPVLGPVFKQPITAHLFSWFGMLYDTFIIFFLMWPPTRVLAYLAVLVFHTVVGILFQIGVFPLVMIGVTLIFFSNDWHRRLLKWFEILPISKSSSPPQNYSSSGFTRLVLYTYVAFQITFPWRYVLYDGNLFWNEEGYRFSWRVMLMEKAGTATFYVKDSKSGREGIVDNTEFLQSHQEKQMAMQPDIILQYAQFLKEYYQKQGMSDPQIRAEVYVTLNARPSRLLINPQLDLTTVEDGWQKKDWVLDYEE